MKQAQKISKEVWQLFKDFCQSPQTDADWETYTTKACELSEQYTGAGNVLARGLSLAYMDYLEKQRAE